MNFNVIKTTLSEVQSLRKLFLSESRFQFICDKCHGAGWADIYVFTSGKEIAGYGSLWGKDKREDRDTIFEFYLLPSFRKFADAVYPEFIKASGALFIECQSNVAEAYRQKGFGSLIIQELKKEASRLKRVPSARCNIQNIASKKALLKAGMRVCGHLLIGELA
jgi:RimJ/RimL family protein N-acetyltransferase